MYIFAKKNINAMIKLAALNEDWSDEGSSEATEERVKETRESEALELYNKALQYQQLKNHERAKEFYGKLLSASFVADVDASEKSGDPQSHPALAFKYSAYKNLGSLEEEHCDTDKAVDFYLEAATIDASDVTLWYRIGKLAVKLNNAILGRYAFEQGLNCNSKHWPCLDELITVLYAVGDYHACLRMISDAFERDSSYPKGLILRDKIYAEYSSFRSDFQHFKGMRAARHAKYDGNLATQVVKEALDLRMMNRQRNVKEEPRPIVPAKHVALYTWSCLGSCLVALHDQVTSDENAQSLCQKVNLENYCKIIITPENEDKRCPNSIKRKRPVTLESDLFNAPKRRSARVSKSKKKQEEVNYLAILQAFLPKSLKSGCVGDNEDSESIKIDSQEDRCEKSGHMFLQGVSTDSDGSNVPDISSENEPLDVQLFIKQHLDNCGTIQLLCDYAVHLTNNSHLKWPVSLIDVFLKIYSKIRPHLSLPSLFCKHSSKTEILVNAQLVLIAVELTLDKWCSEKSKSSSSLSPAGSPRSNGQGVTGSPLKEESKFQGPYFLNDFEYISQAAGAESSLFESGRLKFPLRVNWAKVRFMMFQGQMNLAAIYLDRCKTLIELCDAPVTVHLVNCKTDNVITIDQVKKKLESLQRCQSLEEVHRLFESGQYQEVVDVLLDSLDHPPPVAKVGSGGMSIPERPAQLLLLQDSLLKLKDYKTCLSCAEAAFNEAVGHLTPCEAWSTTLERLFQCLNTILDMDPGMLVTLSDVKVKRLTQNLIKVIEVSMETSETSSDVPLATVMPWILLFRIIQSKEDEGDEEIESVKNASIFKLSEPDPSLPPEINPETTATAAQVRLPLSLQFLRLAHEALGGRSWCVNNDGLFLRLCVDVFVTRLKDASPELQRNRDKLVRELEQCFFCLYGHPSKKAKARGLQEHGSTQIPLTWANAAVVFEFFKPQVLPTFEDKTNTVTSEVQNLLRRITLVIPQTELEVVTVESVQNYIEGSCDHPPSLPERFMGAERPVTCSVFYLLADSYFKNKEFSKAIKFYIHDICSNPNRFDTWAAMALARQVRLEDKLRACETKSEGPIQKHSISTLRCFKRALEIDSSNTNLWGEYGSLCYCLHSYASRQLKQAEAQTPENQKILQERRNDMLAQAKNCFSVALHKPDNDEPWLQYYMLGKIAEKLSGPPEEYLESYLKAFTELEKDGAEYPRKIAYHNPPSLALEALEVGFRFHASVLKLLMKTSIKPDLKELEDYLDKVSKCPFFRANSKTAKDHPQAGLKLSSEKRIGLSERTEPVESVEKDLPEEESEALSDRSNAGEVTENPSDLTFTNATEHPGRLNEQVSEILSENPNQNESPSYFSPILVRHMEKDVDAAEILVEDNNAPRGESLKVHKAAIDADIMEDARKLDTSHLSSSECIPNMDVSSRLTRRCLDALAYCLKRFPQHYKSQYRLAHAYLHISSLKNVDLSRDLLLGSNNAGAKPFNISVQGLFNEKSKTNLFQGIWRIPLDDVDRPGSFCTHMYKCVKLLIDVLDELKEWDSLLLVSSLMYRCPDAGKKYLRDNERLQLASKAFLLSLKLLNDRREECKQRTSPCSLTFGLLTDAYEAYKCSQKLQKYGEETEELLVEVFKLSGLHKDDGSNSGTSLLEEALKFLQLQPKSQAPPCENGEKVVSKSENNTGETPSTAKEMESNAFLQANNTPDVDDLSTGMPSEDCNATSRTLPVEIVHQTLPR